MTGTPPLFADTPEASRDGGDVLAAMLGSVRLTGSVFLDARFSAPFGILTPKEYDDSTPMARLRHVSIFHLIVSGRCLLVTADGQRREVCAGDVVLLPFADAHTFSSDDGVACAFVPELLQPGPLQGMWRVDYGGGGEETRMVCGFVESLEFPSAPVFRFLPSVLVARADDEGVGALLTSTVREIVTLANAASPGTELMLGRLMELLFVEMVRRYAAGLPAGARSWFAALKDPLLGRALESVHADPSRRWTVDELARQAGASRTVLAERFNAVIGQAPIEYLTGWRMQLAAERLRNSGDSLAAIGADVGYESEAAFNRAFKRVTGVTPGRWRESGGTANQPQAR